MSTWWAEQLGSRAVRRLQETGRWVPEALQANVLHTLGATSESSGEEPVEAGTLPRFIEPPTAHNNNRGRSQQRSS